MKASEARLSSRLDTSEDTIRQSTLRQKDLCATIDELRALCDSQLSDINAKAALIEAHDKNAKECERLIGDIRAE